MRIFRFRSEFCRASFFYPPPHNNRVEHLYEKDFVVFPPNNERTEVGAFGGWGEGGGNLSNTGCGRLSRMNLCACMFDVIMSSNVLTDIKEIACMY